MGIRSIVGKSGKWIVLLGCLFPMLSCTTVREAIWPPTQTPTPTVTPTPTPTQTPTPTRVPIAERDFRDILLQKSDLPEGFVEYDIPDLEENLEESIGVYGTDQLGVVLENLETGYACLFISQDAELYSNMILVYTDSGYAQAAYEGYVGMIGEQADEIDTGLVGERSTAFEESAGEMVAYVIVWQYQEAVLNIQYAGDEGIELEELIRLAQIVQGRLEAG